MSDRTPNWDDLLAIASISDIGMRRTSNQDSMVISMASSLERWQSTGHLMIVADGMGAHAAGELASKLAVDHIPHLYHKYSDRSAPEALKRAVVEANAEINRRGQANEDFYNMGTTCSALLLLPQGAVAAHIGDSRVYRVRNNQLQQLTFDHSLVWEMRASGQLADDQETLNAIPKNVITRSLGPYPDVKVDLEGPFPIEVGDIYMLCSDGLTGPVEDSEIGPILANLPPEQACQMMVDLANLRGGPDNITVIVAKVVSQKLTTNPQSSPLKVNVDTKRRVHPLWWAIFLGCIIVAIVLGITNPVSGLVPGIVAAVCLVVILFQLASSNSRGQVVAPGKRFGRGPYTQTNCASAERLLDQLDDLTLKLRDAAVAENWAIDVKQLDEMIDDANQSTKKTTNQPTAAIRAYADCIGFLMGQLRKKQDQRLDDRSLSFTG